MKGWDGVSVVYHSCVTSSNCKSKKVEVPSERMNTWLREVRGFSAGASVLPPFKNQHHQIAIRSGTDEHFRKCSSEVLGFSWVNIFHFLQVTYRSTLSPF